MAISTSPLSSVSFPFVQTFSEESLPQNWRRRLLAWAESFPYAAIYDSCQTQVDRYGRYDWLMGVAAADALRLTRWEEWAEAPPRWWMGGLPYELKNRFEPKLHTRIPAYVAWPEVAFFSPQILIERSRVNGGLRVQAETIEGLQAVVGLLSQSLALPATWEELPALRWQGNFSREGYLAQVERLRAHIREGDFYEINLAQAFHAEVELPHTAALFERLTAISPMPFAGYLQFGDHHLICASPERFLQLNAGQLCSQPIKGTAPRSADPEQDAAHRAYLAHSEKEQAENVMIVDLTRHDLHRSCFTGSVEVPHLFEIQAFPQVYQLVSTITGRKRSELTAAQVLAQTFPPGSMTGAPKVMTMTMIDRYEPEGRGLYAGSLGYLTPEGDFDFNVVIRSLIYQAAQQRLSYHVGGAITYDSDPEREYEETLTKAAAIRQLFA